VIIDACDVTLSEYPHRASLKNMPDHGGNRTYCSIKWSAHAETVFISLLYMRATMHYYILISYSHNKAYNDSLLFVYLSMLLQRFYSLILPNPGVQIAYNKYMSIYSG
jgi:hypothetical protein